MPTKPKHDRETVLDAIKGEGRWSSLEPGKLSTSFGNVMAIAQRLGVHRSTVNNYMKEWSTVADAIKEEREVLKDFAESKIAKHIQNDNVPMTIFYAKTQMQDRGYIERQQIQNINIDVTELNDDELERIANGEEPLSVVGTKGKG